MLPKINRLKKKNDLDRVFKRGRGFKEDFLFVKFIPNHLPVSRFVFIITKKIVSKAVERNKIKRKLSELVRMNISQIKHGFDGAVVILAKPKPSQWREAKSIINKIFKKAKLLN